MEHFGRFQDEQLKISEKVVNMAPDLAQNGAQVGSKINGKSVPRCVTKNGMKKIHATVCGGVRPCATQGVGSLKSLNPDPLNRLIQSPQGDQLRHSLTPLRALRARWRI